MPVKSARAGGQDNSSEPPGPASVSRAGMTRAETCPDNRPFETLMHSYARSPTFSGNLYSFPCLLRATSTFSSWTKWSDFTSGEQSASRALLRVASSTSTIP